MEYDKPYCDKCNGTDFDVVCTDEVKERPIPASNYFHPKPVMEGVLAIMIYSHYKATCRGCGSEYTFTR